MVSVGGTGDEPGDWTDGSDDVIGGENSGRILIIDITVKGQVKT